MTSRVIAQQYMAANTTTTTTTNSSTSEGVVLFLPAASTSSTVLNSFLLTPLIRRYPRRVMITFFMASVWFIRAIFTFTFAIVGLLLGAVTGAMIGVTTESGVCRGSCIGAISGAVYAIEALDSSFALWESTGSCISSLRFVVDIIVSLLSGRLVEDKVAPTVHGAVLRQMNVVDHPFRFMDIDDAMDIFDTVAAAAAAGITVDFLRKLPTTLVADDNDDTFCCSVCLQELRVGEMARRLPRCKHVFHQPCIDSWLIRHASCPLCRQDISSLCLQEEEEEEEEEEGEEEGRR